MTETAVFIVDDHALVRHGLRAFLQTQNDVVVIGEAENGQQAVDEMRARAATQTLPDVMLMDLNLPELDGVGAINVLHKEIPDLKIVVLSSFSETACVHAALQAGATGYLLKTSDPAEISAAIRSAQRDQVHLDPAVARVLARSMRCEPSPLDPRRRNRGSRLSQGLRTHRPHRPRRGDRGPDGDLQSRRQRDIITHQHPARISRDRPPVIRTVTGKNARLLKLSQTEASLMDNRDYPLSSAAAQDVLLDKQAPASDKRHCTRIALGLSNPVKIVTPR